MNIKFFLYTFVGVGLTNLTYDIHLLDCNMSDFLCHKNYSLGFGPKGGVTVFFFLSFLGVTIVCHKVQPRKTTFKFMIGYDIKKTMATSFGSTF